MKNDSEYQHYEFALLIDGRDASNRFCRPRRSFVVDGVHTAADSIRQFIFSRIQLTDGTKS